jgi:hypothetical protein
MDPGAGCRNIHPGRKAVHHSGGMAGGSQAVAGKKRTDQNPESGRSVTQFLSENGS